MDVLVTISGRQGADDPVEVVTGGEYVLRNGRHYLIYEEIRKEGTTKSTLRFDGNECMLRRSGALNVQMIFAPDRKTVTTYSTPYGNMVLGIDTEKLMLSTDESGLELDIEYSLDMNYEFYAHCSLHVEARYKKTPG